ncbi:LOW QUALITY PROTEIN: uncharacterized protein QC763_0041790 [Podospora pseudopauciseta]|uniref:Uncharacterized protein n=2 Tax=Podospora TaxID=5144 RepID=A0ABR0HRF0_9PEZI|nr:LOW QUALITY PROTEIN: hypothetical protein QC763_0041790 [Podospora pseudopauciseta]KAK4680186.1 LOW QUALITY PROTEIN: hypothetical protein QC764_0042460 [Podospora pseudoanserina]
MHMHQMRRPPRQIIQYAHGELDPAALAVGNGVHPPPGIDVENGDELVTTVGVLVPADGAEELVDADVGADDGVEDPFQAEVTPSRPTLKGSLPPMVIVPAGARRFPARRRRRVVLPAPLAPIKRVRDLGGRERVMPERPVEWSWKR